MNRTINLFTIGFTQKTAQKFFDDLQKAGVKRVIDTRLNNVSQLAGFSKKADLEYFLKVIGGIEYVHVLDLAPTQDILDEYKKKKVDWTIYEQKFRQLISSRRIETKVSPDVINNACLLCSEAKPHNCHRRLVAEYLKDKWGNVNICHL
ncbi:MULTISPECIES: DUF488 family protein [Microcystis]|jgi:uncharacterized protein (DUF488 family)|nr:MULTISPECIES: DUF488 domain-containing protein [Microcystis]NCR98745.1 DUF488 domain-containing protein [Microcystis aeruginosa L311-01]OCY14967.1 MAG: hypothetical protein BEV12_04115 [Microcystis aeruginosa CACIAM 03]REJ53053.1 MAG: DUF488 domain-containing protein [Microcystis aeruginosa DA14]TRU00012.1 MAG: DUF488 domain-containing protein [Microcystis aeruginosa Ma_OC_LR_19540900_S633]TRU04812.1 MAG: DUF488 domain-containing protein [Microcystis aeruginosa Ma_MB_F_20061100_S19D]TRU118